MCDNCGNLVTCKNADMEIVGYLCNEKRFYKKHKTLWCTKDCLAGYLRLETVDGKPVKHVKCNKED